MNYSRVASSSDLPVGEMKAVQVEGKNLLLVRSASGLAVLDRKCTHMGADLCKGKIDAGEIVCPKHGARFDARTGQPTGKAKMLVFKMAVKALQTYPVKEEGGAIYVAV